MIRAFERGVRFSCTQCGRCCRSLKGPLPLTVRDVRRISAWLGLSIRSFIERYCIYRVEIIKRPTGAIKLPSVALRVPASGQCRFLTESNMCSIHDVKPYICARSPFMAYVAEGDERNWQEAVSYCPGVGVGAFHDRSTIARLLRTERRTVERELQSLQSYRGSLARLLGTRLPKPRVKEIRQVGSVNQPAGNERGRRNRVASPLVTQRHNIQEV